MLPKPGGNATGSASNSGFQRANPGQGAQRAAAGAAVGRDRVASPSGRNWGGPGVNTSSIGAQSDRRGGDLAGLLGIGRDRGEQWGGKSLNGYYDWYRRCYKPWYAPCDYYSYYSPCYPRYYNYGYAGYHGYAGYYGSWWPWSYSSYYEPTPVVYNYYDYTGGYNAWPGTYDAGPVGYDAGPVAYDAQPSNADSREPGYLQPSTEGGPFDHGSPANGMGPAYTSGAGGATYGLAPGMMGPPAPVDGEAAGPGSPFQLTSDGAAAFASGRYEEAARRFSRAMLADERDGFSKLLYAMAQFAMGHYDLASTALRRALLTSEVLVDRPMDVRTLYADPAVYQAQFDELMRVTNDRPNDIELIFLLAYLVYATGDADSAAQLFEELTKAGDDELIDRLARASRLRATGIQKN